MFRSARWRTERNSKINVVFKLQFHVTQVPQLNVETLAVAVVPGDIGKPTARLENGIIREGICRWEYPIYETVKFTQNTKTGKINDRTYHFIVSTGSSRNCLVGEVSVDLAGYAEVSKVSNVSLPLKNSKCNAILHVTIERLRRDIYRDLEGTKVTIIKIQDRSLTTLLSNSDAEEDVESNCNEASLPDDISHNSELNGDLMTSGSDVTTSGSESSSELNTLCEPGIGNNLLQYATNFKSSQNHVPVSHDLNSNDSGHGIGSNENINSCQITLTGERLKDVSGIGTEKLKAEIFALARQMDLSELELQTLRKQIVKESKRGQDLTRKVTELKEEKNALRAENEKLKVILKRVEDAKSDNESQFEGGDPLVLDKIRLELNNEKDLNANLQMQLQKTQESNAELALAVTNLKELLEQKNRQISGLSSKSKSSENATLRSESDDDEEQKALEEIVREHRDAKEAYLLEQKIMDLSTEIEIYRRDKDDLEMQLEQLALDYEILKQEKHDMSYKLEQSELQEQLKMQYECSSSSAIVNELEAQIENLQYELRKQSEEHSDSLLTMAKLEFHIKSLEDELDRQSQGFEANLEVVIQAKVQLEQRAIRAEEALWKTKRKNANMAEKIQDEFKRLSMQMACTFDANEKVTMKALAEAKILQLQKSRLEEMVQKANEELQSVRDEYEEKMQDFSNQLSLKVDQIEQMLVEIDDKSRQLELQKKSEEKLIGSFSQEILRLNGDLQKLTIGKDVLSQERENLKVESERLKSSIKQGEDLVQKGYMERYELANALALAKREVEKSTRELDKMKSLKEEKEKLYDDFEDSLLEDELEKEELRKQLIRLKGDLKRKEDTITHVKKELSEKSKPANLSERIKLLEDQVKLMETAFETLASSILEKERDLLNKIEELEDGLEELNRKSGLPLDSPCQKLPGDIICITSNGSLAEDTRSTDETMTSMAWISKENEKAKSIIKSSAIMPEKEKTACITSTEDCYELMSELRSLKERNKSMEDELKEMQGRYSEISLRFAEVEGERQQLLITVRNLKNPKKG